MDQMGLTATLAPELVVEFKWDSASKLLNSAPQ